METCKHEWAEETRTACRHCHELVNARAPKLEAINAALLEALEAAERALSAASIADKSLYAAPVTLAARAAIRAAKGESNG
jgi:hypothetical protein